MPILPNIGRKSPKVRLAIDLIYTVLILGSITMVYPFFIMLSGSVKGLGDVDKMDAIPEVAYSQDMQFSRFEEDRYAPIITLSATYSKELFKTSDAYIPKVDTKAVKTYQQFLKDEAGKFPLHFYIIQGMTVYHRMTSRNYRLFLSELRKECGTVDNFNKRYNTGLATWNDFMGVNDQPFIKEYNYERNPFIDRYAEFKQGRPLDEKAVLNIDGYYFNSQNTFPEVRNGKIKPSRILAAVCPKGDDKVLWAEFVKHRLNCLFARLTPEGLTGFRKFLAARYPRGVAEMNKINDTRYSSFNAVDMSYEELRNSAMFAAYTDYITNDCPAENLRVDTPSTRYREYVSSATAIPPFVGYDYLTFKKTKTAFLVDVFTKNYKSVIDYVVVYGRAILNTFIYIGLSILGALLVNPLAAYALSRFKLKSTYMVLMFFLATMAFPGAVTMIPNFLLLKKLHLLNSYWALILPVVANGYSIFILKGFFDSIPKEIYESALIDGAGEWTMFWRFTMALSKPILALITLGAFTAAYTAFMFALIICPDERMWTLMVWLYQLQQDAHQSVINAALVLAALPTLLVFIFAQNTIMKGIVIPVEK